MDLNPSPLLPLPLTLPLTCARGVKAAGRCPRVTAPLVGPGRLPPAATCAETTAAGWTRSGPGRARGRRPSRPAAERRPRCDRRAAARAGSHRCQSPRSLVWVRGRAGARLGLGASSLNSSVPWLRLGISPRESAFRCMGRLRWREGGRGSPSLHGSTSPSRQGSSASALAPCSRSSSAEELSRPRSTCECGSRASLWPRPRLG